MNRPTLRSLLLIALLSALPLSGCTRRTVAVRSDPAGAKVYFDGEEVGTTPAEFPFKWYGGHRIRLEKEGYRPVVEIVDLDAPVHMTVPADFVTELIPYEFKDRHEFAYTLESE